MPHEINRQAIDPIAVGVPPAEVGQQLGPNREERRKMLAELLAGIRRDQLPTGAEKPLADEFDFHPLVVDAKGRMWVRLSDDQKIKTTELQQILLRIELVLREQLELLRKIA